MYLADTAAAVRAVADFTAVLSGLAPDPLPVQLRAEYPRLAEARDRTALLAERLGAERLEDRRLEEQRQDVSAILDDVVSAMDDLTSAARAGAPKLAEAASADFSQAVGRLRGLAAPS